MEFQWKSGFDSIYTVIDEHIIISAPLFTFINWFKAVTVVQYRTNSLEFVTVYPLSVAFCFILS